MPNPIVHFEISAKGDRAKAQVFYSGLFGWHINPEDGINYSMIDTHSNDEGINGGISGDGPNDGVTIYVQVDDLQSTLEKAESLGGRTVTSPMEIPNVVSLARFADPEGNLVEVAYNPFAPLGPKGEFQWNGF